MSAFRSLRSLIHLYMVLGIKSNCRLQREVLRPYEIVNNDFHCNFLWGKLKQNLNGNVTEYG